MNGAQRDSGEVARQLRRDADVLRARQAGDRRGTLATFGLPADARYHWLLIESAGPGDVTARYGLVQDDGRLGLYAQHPVQEVPGASWPRPYGLMVYGVEARYRDAIEATLAAAGLSARGRALPVLPVHPWGEERGALFLVLLRLTADHPGTPLVAERRLRVDLAWEAGLVIPDRPYTADQRTLAEAGLAHLRDWQARHAGGRPKEAGKRFAVSPEDVVEAYLQLQHAGDALDPVRHRPEDERPTYQEVADRLLLTRGVVLSARTLKRRVKDWRRPWPPTGWPEWGEWELREQRAEEDG